MKEFKGSEYLSDPENEGFKELSESNEIDIQNKKYGNEKLNNSKKKEVNDASSLRRM